jgi:hypothetical protein
LKIADASHPIEALDLLGVKVLFLTIPTGTDRKSDTGKPAKGKIKQNILNQL